MSTYTISIAIDEIAVRQHGVVTREDLLLAGIGPTDIERAVSRR